MFSLKLFALIIAIWAANIQTNAENVPAHRHATDGAREKRSDDNGPLDAVVLQQAQELNSLRAELAAMKAEQTAIKAEQAAIKAQQATTENHINMKGSTFVRWGRTHCPNGTTTVYSGYAGGGYAGNTGTGANRICLTSDPVHDDTAILSTGHGTVYGAQYHLSGHSSATDVLCSLCHTSFSATFMVPGTNRCPSGTTEQYKGYLSVGNYGSAAASEYLCLDSNPEDRPGSSGSQSGAWFDHTAAVCGTLPCPPYVSGKAVTCVVCSK